MGRLVIFPCQMPVMRRAHTHRHFRVLAALATIIVLTAGPIACAGEPASAEVKLNITEQKAVPHPQDPLTRVEGQPSVATSGTNGYVGMSFVLAVENQGPAPISGVHVEVTYPPAVNVVADGERRPQPDGTFIVESVVNTLAAGGVYSMDASRIEVPFAFKHIEKCALDEKRMPVCRVITWAANGVDYEYVCERITPDKMVCANLRRGEGKPIVTTLAYRVSSDGQILDEGTFELRAAITEPIESEDIGNSVYTTTEVDDDWDGAEIAQEFGPIPGEVLDSWDQVMGPRSKHPVHVQYKRIRSSHGDIHQELYVDGVLRKTLIGEEDWVWRQITNVDGDPAPDVQKLAIGRFWMLEWSKDQFIEAYES